MNELVNYIALAINGTNEKISDPIWFSKIGLK